MDDIRIDGSHGEGGGQILRTAVTLAAITGRPFRIEDIRAARPKPGLAAQHVVAARAAASLCRASLEGDILGSQTLRFVPRATVAAGDYFFEVSEARPGGSAGSATLVLQSVLLPLSLAGGRSTITIRGGTHMAWAPSYDFIRDVWLPALRQMGVVATTELRSWGWYPVGRGEIFATVEGIGQRTDRLERRLRPMDLIERGKLAAIVGRAVVADLPVHIAQRMAERARTLLLELDAATEIAIKSTRAACRGAGIFLTARYERVSCGFSALGEPGKPAESVAEEAAAGLLNHHRSNAAVDPHLADQIVLPLCFADGPSRFTIGQPTRHLETNAWVIERFGIAGVTIERKDGGAIVTVAT